MHNLLDVQFVFVGDGKERENLQRVAERLNLTNVTFAGTVPKDMMPQVLAAADVGLAVLKNIKMFGTTYPNKVFDYMASGRPTILVIDGVIREVIQNADGGIFVPPGDAIALAQAVRTMYTNQDTHSPDGRECPRIYHRSFRPTKPYAGDD